MGGECFRPAPETVRKRHRPDIGIVSAGIFLSSKFQITLLSRSTRMLTAVRVVRQKIELVRNGSFPWASFMNPLNICLLKSNDFKAFYFHGDLDRLTSSPFAHFKCTFHKTDRGFLTIEEIEIFWNAKFDAKRLEEVRDCFSLMRLGNAGGYACVLAVQCDIGGH
jgi:hypothetical protein